MPDNHLVTVYLDSSDYSTLSDPARHSAELREIRSSLESFARSGVRFVYSGTHLFEMSPVQPSHASYATERADLLVALCGKNALVSFDRLLAQETSRLVQPDAAPVQPFSSDGTWFPPIENVLHPVSVAQTAHKVVKGLIEDLALTGQARKRLKRRLLSPGGEPRPFLVQKIKELCAEADLSELLQRYPMRPDDMRVLWRYVAGEATAAEAELAFLASLRDPSWMMRWFANHHDTMSPVMQWVRDSARGFVDNMGATTGVARELAPHLPTSRSAIFTAAEWRDLQDGSVLRLANSLLAQWHPGTPKCEDAALVHERCPGLSTMVRILLLIVRDAVLPQSRKLAYSDYVDALHAMYAPYVQVFRADRYVAPHIQRVTAQHGTCVVASLRELPAFLETHLRSRNP